MDSPEVHAHVMQVREGLLAEWAKVALVQVHSLEMSKAGAPCSIDSITESTTKAAILALGHLQ